MSNCRGGIGVGEARSGVKVDGLDGIQPVLFDWEAFVKNILKKSKQEKRRKNQRSEKSIHNPDFLELILSCLPKKPKKDQWGNPLQNSGFSFQLVELRPP